MKRVILLQLFFKFSASIPYFYNNDHNNYAKNNNYDDHHAYITRYDGNTDEHGAYYYSFETSNGIQQSETADIINPGSDNEALAVRGSYSYMAPDGNMYMVEYTADQNGFQPSGDHIPASAGVRKLGLPSAALASLAGGGLG